MTYIYLNKHILNGIEREKIMNGKLHNYQTRTFI